VREVKSMWVTIALPSSAQPCGSVVEAFWYVDGDTVCLCDGEGRPAGVSEKLTVLGNERAVASRLRKREWVAESGASDFNRSLNYSRGGVA
jgi:hypothetical protein